jgi:hypothetical protein
MRRKKSNRPRPSNAKQDLSEIKELLGPLAAKYTDAQLDQLGREMALGSSLLLGLYLERKSSPKEPGAAFDTGEDKR